MIQRFNMAKSANATSSSASSSSSRQKTHNRNGSKYAKFGDTFCNCCTRKGVFLCTILCFIAISLVVVYFIDYSDESCEGVWKNDACVKVRQTDRKIYLKKAAAALSNITENVPLEKLQSTKTNQTIVSPETEEHAKAPSKPKPAHLHEIQGEEEEKLHEYKPGCYSIHPLQQKLLESEIMHDFDTKHLSGIITHHRMGTQMFSNMLFLYADRVGFSYQLTVGSQNLGGGTKPDFQSVRLLSDSRLVSSQHGLDECCNLNPRTDCELFNVTCKLDACELIPPPKHVHWSLVHVVRNPVEIIMSSYLYHNQEDPQEPWLHNHKPELLPYLFPDDEESQKKYADVEYYKLLNQVESAIGLRAEVLINLEELLWMVTNHRDVQKLPHAKNYKFEDIMGDVVGECREILKYLGIVFDDIASADVDKYLRKNFDLSTMRSDRKGEALQHVTEGKFNKTELAQVIYDQEDLRGFLTDIGQRVGYKDPFSRLHKKSAVQE